MSSNRVRCEKCGTESPSLSFTGCPVCQLEKAISSDSPTRGFDEIPEALEPAALDEKFDDLEVIELLGSGGMGVVYLARQLKLDRFVALKVIRPDIAESDQFEARFEREARTLARLNHPNIVGVHDFGKRGGLFFCLMEYVDGTNLAELAMSQSLTAAESLQIVSDVCNAIQFAHDNNVVHRDIKPNNILINTRGQVKIADFGLAKLNDPQSASEAQLTQTRQVFGTPKYMAPEQIESAKEVDHRADIYSLGVVFYELLTGELPIGRFDPPSQRIQVDVKLDEVVLRALEKHPERRYQSARQMQTDISGFIENPVAAPVKNSQLAMATQNPKLPSHDLGTQPFSSVLQRMIGASLIFASVYMSSQCITLMAFRTRQTWWFLPLIVMFLICLPVGIRLLVSGTNGRNRNPGEKRKTPPQLIFSIRGLSYLCCALCLMSVGFPWIKMSYINIYFATGIETWIGLGVLIVLAIGLILLFFIDIYEGINLRFNTALLLLGIILVGFAWGFCINERSYYALRQSLIVDFLGLHISSGNFKMSAGAPTLLVLSHIIAGLGAIGLIGNAISSWRKTPASTRTSE